MTRNFFFLSSKSLYPVIAQLTSLHCLHPASGRFLVAALTNNFQLPDDDPREVELLGGKPPAHLVSLFDEFIESSVVGLRFAPNLFLVSITFFFFFSRAKKR